MDVVEINKEFEYFEQRPPKERHPKIPDSDF
jgi:hypothetical protein